MDFTHTIFTLIPPIIAIAAAIITRRVIFSLGLGIISGALLLHNLDPAGAAAKIFQTLQNVFITSEESTWSFNTWNIFILLFLLILGVLTSFISMMGGTRAFGEWASKRVKTRTGAKLFTIVLGIIVFIDDYFNSLTVGQVSRPITDRYHISRSKLAYYLDSTAAPICVVSPISSWGAYIIGIIGTVLVTHQITDYSAFTGFLYIIPMNFYAIAALLTVIFTAWFNINLGAMRQHEQKAIASGVMEDDDIEQEQLPESNKGKVGDLIWPILALVIGTVAAMTYTGYQAVIAAGDNVTMLSILENTDVSKSLVYGGLIGLLVTFLAAIPKKLSFNAWKTGFVNGIQSMLPAIYILITAWTITSIISELETGAYLADLVKQWNLPLEFLPALIFVLAAFMAFSTGTSWGAFGLLLPIAGEIAANTDISYMLPLLASVLAGSVLGDHCSPISDTTILSSIGAKCNHMNHVITQLPYAILGGAASFAGYVVLGFTGSPVLGLVVVVALLFGFLWYLKKAAKPILVDTTTREIAK